MTVLQINAVLNGSTGKIARGIQAQTQEMGHKNIIACRYTANKVENTLTVSSWLDCHIHNRIYRSTMLQGYFSFFHTLYFLWKVKKLKPDLVHLHNIHGSYINLPLLFNYLKRTNTPVVWTMHDCWAITGGCCHFSFLKCNQWKSQCEHCVHAKSQKTLIDSSRLNYALKKRWFSGIDMIIVSNSKWTASQIEQSFLKTKKNIVIYNGIDLMVFKPTEGDFVRKNHLENKKIILGVAFDWGIRKGLDIFISLSQMLPDTFQIVLVGTNDEIDKLLPANIISIHKTDNQKQLAELYSCATVFVNPTREEAFGLVNIEALACGTPGITFNTGGAPECYNDKCGVIVECDDIDAMKKEIFRICKEQPFSSKDCIEQARKFEESKQYAEYVKLYEEIVNDRSAKTRIGNF